MLWLTTTLWLAVAGVEDDAAALLAGAAEVQESSEAADSGAWTLLDGDPRTAFEAQAQGEPVRIIVKLARSTKVARLGLWPKGPAKVEVHGSPVPDGKWRLLGAAALSPGSEPTWLEVKGEPVRYLRLTLRPAQGTSGEVSLSELRALGQSAKDTPGTFTGAWETTGGELVLKQSGARVTGCWLGEASKQVAVVDGVAAGRTLYAQWDDGDGRKGELAVTLDDDGALAGVHGNHLEDSHGRLDGPKLRTPVAQCEAPEALVARALAKEGRVALGGLVLSANALAPESRGLLAAALGAGATVLETAGGDADEAALRAATARDGGGSVVVRRGVATALRQDTPAGRLAARLVTAARAPR